MPTRTQQLAQTCYRLVNGVRGTGYAADYGRWCFRLAPLVLQNGLVQTLGFLAAKAPNNEGAQQFRAHLAEILRLDTDQSIGTVRDASLADYQRYTRLALAAALWFRRYAETELELNAAGIDGGRND